MMDDAGYVWEDGLVTAGLKEQHFPVVDFSEAIGHNSSGRSSSDDDEIVLVQECLDK